MIETRGTIETRFPRLSRVTSSKMSPGSSFLHSCGWISSDVSEIFGSSGDEGVSSGESKYSLRICKRVESSEFRKREMSESSW